MSENLSIDEILRQAEEIRKKTAKKAESTIEAIHNTEEPIEIEKTDRAAKTASFKKVSDKTKIVPSTAVKAADDIDIVSDKTRPVRLEQKTGVVPELNKRRTSFFRGEATKEPVYSKEPPEIIEKPATIKSKSKFDKTSDLQEIPTILAVEELERTRIMGTMAETDQEETEESDIPVESAQIKLEGFDDEIEDVPDIDEQTAERILIERRKDKVNKFRLFAPEETHGENAPKRFVKSDFRNSDEKTAIMERLFSQKSSVHMSIVFTVIFGSLLLALTLLRDTAYLPAFLAPNNTYYISVIVLYALVMISNIHNIANGFNFKNGIHFDFPITIVSILIMAHTVMLYLNPDLLIDGGSLLPSSVTLAFFMSSMGKRTLINRVIENFEFITDSGEKYTVETIRNEVDSAIISRGLLKGEPVLKSSVKTDFPTGFLEIGCSDDPADRISATTGSVMLLLNAVLFAVVTLVTKNWHIGINAAACGLCISIPTAALYATNLAVAGVSHSLAKNHAMVNGFAGAHMMDDANALVIEAHDLFGPKSCDLHGIKTFNGAKIDDAILQTAAVIIKTKSPLAHVFDDVIVGKQSILPEVDSIVYEDKMGTSGWIYRKKILVGNRDLLIHHGVSVPKIEYEEKYTRKGRKALYLAVAGKIMAMFIVSYGADAKMKKALRKLEKSGLTILVHSCDPFINEESITELFSLPEGYVRVMNAASGRVFEKYSDLHVNKSPAHAVHDGSCLGFISAMRGAEALEDMRSVLSVLVSFGSVIGFGVIALLALIGGYNQLTVGNVLIFQCVWSLFVLFVTKMKRLDI